MRFISSYRAGTRRQGGFTLLEAMISLVILSVGMLGIAALYVEGLRAGRTAVYRTVAVALASDMMDRIRANRNAANAYAGASANNNCTNGVNCDPSEMAADDIRLWEAQVAQQLPMGADTSILFQALGAVNQYTITVSWPEAGYEEDLSYVLIARM